MKKRLTALILCALLVLGAFPTGALAAPAGEEIVILYENDVHCAVEGYSKLSALKQELQQTYAHVGVVSGGDYIQGSSLGAASQGRYIVELMNLVGYDAVTLGNHEFDYRFQRLTELVDLMDVKPVSCNFSLVGEDASYFAPYSMVSYGDVDIAYVGITTPSTVTSSSPAQFKDENGDYLYTFHPTDLYEVVQDAIDSAKDAGAEYVIALSHIGYAEDEIYGDLMDVEDLIANTEGFDVVLDAHSHSVIEGMTLLDEGGNEVLLSSTGTKFEHIGKLTISEGSFETELIKTADYQKTDPAVDAAIARIYSEYSTLGDRKVGVSEVALITKDANGKRLVRNSETNLGDLCAEAIRSVMDADIGYINGGGIRADVPAGELTFNHLLSVFPFNNTIVKSQITGRTLLDMMEMAMMVWPQENGSFPHLAGLRFSVNTDIPSSVMLDALEEFVAVAGPYRVYDLQVLDRETGNYVPVDPEGSYTIASHNYALVEHGSGMKMLEDTVILEHEGLLDVEALERYVTETLGGVIGTQYATAAPNITFTGTGAAACPKDETCPLHPFTDLADAGERHNGLHYCLEEGLMQGAAADRFAPDETVSRGQFVALLWQLADSAAAEPAGSFSDVPDSDPYSSAVRWAAANGIVLGYGDDRFGPNDTITREQVATVLWRYAKHKGLDVSVGEDTNILSYTDARSIAAYAVPAMQWACGAGLMDGTEADGGLVLAPQGGLSRSACADLIYRFCTQLPH